MRSNWAAGLTVVALAAGLTACTGGGDVHETKNRGVGRPARVAKACAGGTFTWSGVTKTDRLTGVSPVQKVGNGGGKLTAPLARVYTPRPSVRAWGPTLSSAEVLFSLGKKIGEIEPDAPTLDGSDGEKYAFTDVHAKAPGLDDASISLDGSGTFVEYAGVREVTGDFRYLCPGGTTTTGRARTWQVVLSGTLDCKESVGHSRLALQAARRSCEPDSPATREG